jgi:hypothetical protein
MPFMVDLEQMKFQANGASEATRHTWNWIHQRLRKWKFALKDAYSHACIEVLRESLFSQTMNPQFDQPLAPLQRILQT